MQVDSNGLQIEVEDSGPTHAPAVLLIMGLGMQLTAWPQAWVAALVQAGFRVIRFDNRDAGLSTQLDALGVPKVLWAGLKHKLGWRQRPAYTLNDMALDALGVLDALGISRIHVVGASMGGMIAQRVALAAPQRVLSLCSIMSSSGASGLPDPDREVLKQMYTPPPRPGVDAAIDHTLLFLQMIASPAYPQSEAVRREQIVQAFQRAYRPAGLLRQTLAVMADTARAQALSQITAPTLVMHGDADRLVPPACGQDTARRIPGAQFQAIAGMGHDFSPGACQRMLDALLPFLIRYTPLS
ncbi:MAG: alpha/beta hydrolase [Alphaproteobacteria bacterium]|nr:alpha/beta hydrolase [Alphaproteobacteria bacterium]